MYVRSMAKSETERNQRLYNTHMTNGYGSGCLQEVAFISIYCLCVADVGGPHIGQELAE